MQRRDGQLSEVRRLKQRGPKAMKAIEMEHGRHVGEQGSLECKARGYRVELSEEIEGYLIGEERKKLRPSERHKL